MGSSSRALAIPPVITTGRWGAIEISLPARLTRLLPLWGMLLAGALIISRRPDAVTQAQFWAEDGKLFYADVYTHGVLATLAIPQAGYFQELPILAAGIARLVPLALAPLVMNSIAIAIRALPVGLLLSRRAETISPDIRVRALLAALYIAVPGAPESNANVDNALWFLAVAALIVLMLRPPQRRSARALDVAIVAICSVTGVFSIALAPLAFVYRRWRGPSTVDGLLLAILTAGAAIQLLAIFVLQYHLPAGFVIATRTSDPLHPSVIGFFQIFGARVIAEPLLGDTIMLSAATATLLGLLSALGAVAAFRRGPAELKLTIAFGGALFGMALAHPIGDWSALMVFPDGSRYFIIPQLATVVTLVWAIGHTQGGYWRPALTIILAYICLVTAPLNWRYAPLEQTGFTQLASAFERAHPGTRWSFPLEPEGWSMTLVKQ